MPKAKKLKVLYENGETADFDKARFEKSLSGLVDSESADAVISAIETDIRSSTGEIPIARLAEVKRNILNAPIEFNKALAMHTHQKGLGELQDNDLVSLHQKSALRLLEVTQKLMPYTTPSEINGQFKFQCGLPAGPEVMGVSAAEFSFFHTHLDYLNSGIASGKYTINRYGYFSVQVASGNTPNGGKWEYEVTILGTSCLCFDTLGAKWLVSIAGSGEAAAIAALIAVIPEIGPIVVALLGALVLVIAAMNAIGSKGVCIYWGPPFLPPLFPPLVVLPRF